MVWGFAVEMVLLAALFAGMYGYTAALDSARASGTYDFRPLGPLGPRYTESRSLGQFEAFEIEFNGGGLLAVAGVELLAFVVFGRTWRAIPAWRRRYAND